MKSDIEKLLEAAIKKDSGVNSQFKINQLRQFLSSPVFKDILFPIYNQIRENLIKHGVKDKSPEAWAALEAADLVINAPYTVLNNLNKAGAKKKDTYQAPTADLER